MILNAERQTVAEVVARVAEQVPHIIKAELRKATCPGCSGGLVGVRPTTKRWHWRHAVTRPAACTASYESEWHLNVKWAAKAMGYEVEYTLGDWRFDAFSDRSEFIVIEAVNSLSDRYYDKADAISALGERALWVLNEKLVGSSEGRRLADHLRNIGQTVWWLGDRAWTKTGPARSILAAKMVSETTGVSYDTALVALAEERLTHHAALIAKALENAQRRQRAREAEEREQKTRDWKNRQPFSQTVDWVKSKMHADGRVADYVAWRMIKDKGETRKGMPIDPPYLSYQEQQEVRDYYPKFAPPKQRESAQMANVHANLARWNKV